MITSAAVIWLVIRKTDFELSSAATMRQAFRLWPSAALTLAAHAAMLLAYLVVLGGLALPDFTTKIVAALTIVMFTASLPIGFSGWEIRELSATQALGIVGVDPAVAVAGAVAIGLMGSLLNPHTFRFLTVDVDRTYRIEDRWNSILEGWQMWLDYPLFGGGLGAYVQMRLDQDLPHLVIHSIPVWLLAETGIFGALVIAVVLALCLHAAFRMMAKDHEHGWGLGLLIVLGAITASGLVHDFFFQRNFWFLLGLYLALPSAASRHAGKVRV